MTHCLTCRHMMIQDWEENRVLRCGHSDVMSFDTNLESPVIVYLEWGSNCLPLQPPAWCPLLESTTTILPNQMSLFGDE